MEETLSFEAYMLTIYEQTWNRIVNSLNIGRTSPVI